MTNYHYHIRKFGFAFVVGTDEEEILVCADRKVATQIALEAQETEMPESPGTKVQGLIAIATIPSLGGGPGIFCS